MIPAPMLPEYQGANVRGLMPALLAPRDGARPSWMPSVIEGAEQVVVLVLDGLGWVQLEARAALAPTLMSMSGGPITTVAPSTTATALTSITTGLTPGEHGLIGYRIDVGGDVLNVLRWNTDRGGDARRAHDPRHLQPFTPFLGLGVPVVSKIELEGSAFSAAHLRGGRPRGWRTSSGIAVEVHELLTAGEPVVYAYYDGVDKVAHEKGFGPYYDAEVAAADRIVHNVIEALTPGAALIVTADHGQVQVGDAIRRLPDAVSRHVHHASGEGRFRWLHARPGMAGELLRAATDTYAHEAWVVTRGQTLDECWFGPVVSGPVQHRLGDVALVAFEPVSFDDAADTGPFPLVCRHGSLTREEMLVPLLAARR